MPCWSVAVKYTFARAPITSVRSSVMGTCAAIEPSRELTSAGAESSLSGIWTFTTPAHVTTGCSPLREGRRGFTT